MKSGLKIIPNNVAQVVAVTTCVDHLKKFIDDPDIELVQLYRDAAISHAERYLQRFLRPTTITESFPRFEQEYDLKYIDVSETSVKVQYLDKDGALQTVPTSVYYLNDFMIPCTVGLADGQSWPTDTSTRSDAIRIEYQAGYGIYDELRVPKDIIDGILLVMTDMYEKRSNTVSRFPSAAQRLFDMHRLYSY